MSTMPPRLPLRSINENVDYHGDQFHVQTEDSAPIDTSITTHVYRGGVIIAAETISYSNFVSEDHADVVRSMMLSQHRQLKMKLIGGGLDVRISAEEAKDRGEEEVPVQAPADVRVPLESLFTPTPATSLPAVTIPKQGGTPALKKAAPKLIRESASALEAEKEQRRGGAGRAETRREAEPTAARASRVEGKAAVREDESAAKDWQETVVDEELSAHLNELFVDSKSEAAKADEAQGPSESPEEQEVVSEQSADSTGATRPPEMNARGSSILSRHRAFAPPKAEPAPAAPRPGEQVDVLETLLSYLIEQAD